MKYEESIAWLKQETSSSPLSKISPQDSLENARRLMGLFDDPQNATPAIHVAGTMGKGTVTKLITNMLVAHGKKVVSLYSPHTYDQRERIELNSQMISEEDLSGLIKNLQGVATGRMTYFNAMMLMGFMYAREQKADLVVVETGIGGQYDTSNTIRRDDKVCVLTKVGLDHQSILGDTLEQIAGEKAGIIQAGSTVFSYSDQHDGVKNVFDQSAAKYDARIMYAEPIDLDLAASNPRLSGEFNRYNVGQAFDVAEHMLGDSFDQQVATSTIKDYQLPGRFEIISKGDKTFIFDTAHNRDQIKALYGTFKSSFGNLKPGLIFAGSSSEHAQDCIELLAMWCDPIIITKYSEPTLDMWKPAVDVDYDSAIKTATTEEAVRIMRNLKKQQVWLITGSTYHLKELRLQLQSS